MNQMTPPPKIEIIPSSAPFSEAQRSWLEPGHGRTPTAPAKENVHDGILWLKGLNSDADGRTE